MRTVLEQNSSPPELDGHHFADDLLINTFVKYKPYILNKISLKFVSKGAIDNNPTLV